jgi:hypothetical protein
VNRPFTAADYRRMAEHVRKQTYRREDGSPDRDRLNNFRAELGKAAIENALAASTAAEMRREIDPYREVLLDDEGYIAFLLAQNVKEADRYERLAAEIEAQESAQAVAQ